MKTRRNRKFHLSAKHLFGGLSGLCLLAIFLSLVFGTTFGPLNAVAGTVFIPLQKGINSVGTYLTAKADYFKTVKELLAENEALQTQVDDLTTSLNTLKLEQAELETLRELFELDEKYPSYEKVGARVIGKETGNWFSTFIIDKGSDDGIAVDMNVIAGCGLVGIVIDVGPNYAKVRSIIDDNSSVSGATISTGDYCIVKGDLTTMIDSQTISFTSLSLDDGDVIEIGEQIVTSNISSKYLPGILIGYVSSVEADANQLTWSGTITPVVDFKHLSEVLVILDLKVSVEE